MSNNARRYRLSDDVALSLGCKLNKGRRYKLSVEQESQYLKIKPRRIFFDIETSPCVGYFWRPGYAVNISYENIIEESKIICICYKWEGDDKTHYLTWDKNKCDKKMIEKFAKIASEAAELIGHNGDRFDVKWIKTRAVYHRIPFPYINTLDTLKKARGTFKFNSNRLDYIAQYLGVGGKTDTGGFKLWVGCMEGDKESLDKMVEYCLNDVIILEDVYQVMKNYHTHNTHMAVEEGGDKWDCPTCMSDKVIHEKNSVTRGGTIKRDMRCQSCGQPFKISNRDFLKFMNY